MGDIREFIADGRILSVLRDPRNRLILVLGGSDSGKTTFVACLADRLSTGTAVGVVDLDAGQSRIGPPTTVGWGKVEGGFRGWQSISVEGFFFTGALSHAGNLLPAIVGAKLVTEAALAACRKVVVDTSGLAAGPIGRVLKQSKIDLLEPDVVLAFERGSDLAPILDSFALHAVPRVIRLPVPAVVNLKSPERRVRHRQDLFTAYFAGARTVSVSLDAVGVRFTREPEVWERERFAGRLVSFRDDRNRDLALGVIEDFAPRNRRLRIRTPLAAAVPVAALVVGTARLERKEGLGLSPTDVAGDEKPGRDEGRRD
jgi:polynucleotide 5'-hydroxyl-kinase GRC3/NOL9